MSDVLVFDTREDLSRAEPLVGALRADARTRPVQRAILHIDDRGQNFPSIGRTIAQLSAPNTGLKALSPVGLGEAPPSS
jgi:hypothetical protein